MYQIGLVYAPAGCSPWFESTGLFTDPVGMPDPHDCAQHEDRRNIRPQVRVLIRVKESLWDHYQAVQQIGENAPVKQGRVRPRINRMHHATYIESIINR